MVLVQYVFNMLVEQGVLVKNYVYLLIIVPILFIGVFSILYIFEQGAKDKK